jgi:hypothetical protein
MDVDLEAFLVPLRTRTANDMLDHLERVRRLGCPHPPYYWSDEVREPAFCERCIRGWMDGD